MATHTDFIAALAAVFTMAACAPWLTRLAGRAGGVLLALAPLAMALVVARDLGGVPALFGLDWASELGARLSFRLDGLSRLFALTIAGVGALIVIYAHAYLAGHRWRGRFMAMLMLFMGAMLGLVTSDNFVALFAFWELTAISSFLLIGFDAHRAAARRAATQALVITGAGGLALMLAGSGFAAVTGSWEIGAALAAGPALTASGLYGLVLAGILLAAFTKSAQVPFHLWLPNAMEAPTPVSAFLHSATMVQAGVYLLARMSPVLGGTPGWTLALTLAGGLTLLWGAMMAFRQTDLKQILAQSTVASLGLLVLLLGMGGQKAALAVAAYFLAHALFKAALFLVAGIVDHATGTREIGALGGLRRPMPLSFAATLLAVASMLGLPPWMGYLAKEEIYAAASGMALWSVVLVVGNSLVGAAGLVMLRPFLGAPRPTPTTPHEAGWAMLAGPLLLGGLGLVLLLAGDGLADMLLGPFATSVVGAPVHPHLALLPDFGAWPIWLSLLTWALAGGLAMGFDRIGDVLRRVPAVFDPLFDRLYLGLVVQAGRLVRVIQHGRLERYAALAIGATAVALLLPMVRERSWPALPGVGPLTFYEWGAVAIAAAGLAAVVAARTRLGAVVALGIQGLALSLIFVFFGAPDLGFTQLMVETLSVVILALVMTRLRLSVLDPRPAEDWLRDGGLAVGLGSLITLLLLRVLDGPLDTRLSTFFAENSVPVAHGRNIVNVILVDFRGLDTLGEISVVMAAGIVVLTLIRSRVPDRGGQR